MILEKYLKRLFVLLALATFVACGTDKNVDNETPADQTENPTDPNRKPVDEPVVDGDPDVTRLWWTPSDADADMPLTISFRAGTDSPLRGYKGDVYAHLGVVSKDGTEWIGAGEWGVNRDDRKLYADPEHENVWHLRLSPSIREYLLPTAVDKETPCFSLGVVIRDATGNIKGIAGENGEGDTIIPVADDLFGGTDVWCTPEIPNADGPVTITFRAGKESQLRDYEGDIYAHIGIIEYGTWKCVQAEWTENIDKCKFTKDPSVKNLWHLTLGEGTVREYFNSGTMPCVQIGIVIRSEDSKKKGIDEDRFFAVVDDKYKPFESEIGESLPIPAGCTYGINVSDDKTAITFVLHDKDTNGEHRGFAYILGDFNDWKLTNDSNSRMYRDDAMGCWWLTVSGLDPQKEYRYQYHVGDKTEEFDQVIRMADAFCEKVLDPDNDKWINEKSTVYNESLEYPEGGAGLVSVVKTSRDEYQWQVTGFKPAEDLIIYEMLFRDFSATKDIAGALEKLDYLKAMGVNAVELMPVQEFDGNDSWGYSPCFYFAMDKAYGTRTQYKQFIDECHKRGMAVIVDVVYNHNTGASPLAKLYWDAKNNRTAENNPYFNVLAKHPYNVYHQFNHTNAFVNDLVKRSTLYLIDEYNIDGFRFDLTKGFSQKQCNDDNAAKAYNSERIGILKQYAKNIHDHKSDAIVILEHFCDYRESKELAQNGMKLWGNRNYAYCQSAMGKSGDSSFDGFDGPSGFYNPDMPFGSLVGYMESHDEERAASKQKGMSALKNDIGKRMQRLELNAAFFLTVPGPKMIWQFGEYGYDVSINYNGRTGAKPLHWEYLDEPARKALYDTYSQLLKFRHDNPEFFRAEAEFKWSVSGWPQRTITCKAGNKAFAVVGNFDLANQQSVTVQLPLGGAWKDAFTGQAVSVSNNSYTENLQSGEFKLIKNF